MTTKGPLTTVQIELSADPLFETRLDSAEWVAFVDFLAHMLVADMANESRLAPNCAATITERAPLGVASDPLQNNPTTIADRRIHATE